MSYATFRDARIAWVRRQLDTHRECCGHLFEFRLVQRALDMYDGKPLPFATYAADTVVVRSMVPHGGDWNTNSARMARWLYAATGRPSEVGS